MSTVTETISAGPAAPAAEVGAAGAAPQLVNPPRLADGTELLGEFRDSADSQPPSLVRRPDGQVIQMSKLLYLTAAALDGHRDEDAIAQQVSAGLGKTLTAEQARYLITAKLAPLGVLAVEGAPAAAPTANQLLPSRRAAPCCPTAPPPRPAPCCGRCSARRSSPPSSRSLPPWTTGSSPSTAWAPGWARCCATRWA